MLGDVPSHKLPKMAFYVAELSGGYLQCNKPHKADDLTQLVTAVEKLSLLPEKVVICQILHLQEYAKV